MPPSKKTHVFLDLLESLSVLLITSQFHHSRRVRKNATKVDGSADYRVRNAT
jgi:hypothetical protein